MDRNYIKYEELSSEIKKEIEHYFEEIRAAGKSASREEAMLLWFEKEFDTWMVQNYAGRDKRDRRLVERRRHPRVEVDPEKTGKRGPDRRASVRRRHFRLDIEVPVRVVETLIESSSDETEAFDFVGTLVNISKGGFYFNFGQPIEISSIIRVHIDLSAVDEDLRDIEALAMVVRVDRLSSDNYGVGVMFSSIYDEHREKLEMFIFQNLAYYIYRNGG
ncbi:MAG: PilZ domain-containing protein [Spirochaetota bacterium]|nr:PilZ domain-containing protein [Spirochaetota bacterium]HPI15686.1 PilZ domain-containing protein [Spirochaetota bacterium]